MKSFLTKQILAALFISSFTGCAMHRQTSAHILLDKSCLTAPIMMDNCDFASPQPRCRNIKVSYRKGCERLEASHVESSAEQRP